MQEDCELPKVSNESVGELEFKSKTLIKLLVFLCNLNVDLKDSLLEGI